MGKWFKMDRRKGNFSKKQQARAMEHVSVKPNERRKKLFLLQMQRGKVIKCRQIWQGSQKCKDVPFILIIFPSVLILFHFTRCHVWWCMQTCNVYMDSTIIFYFLFCRDSSIIWQAIFNQGEWHNQSVIKMSWDRRHRQMDEPKQISHQKISTLCSF